MIQGTGQIRQPDGSAGRKEKWPRPLNYPDLKVEPKDVMAASDLERLTKFAFADEEYDRWSKVILPNRPLVMESESRPVTGITDENPNRDERVDLGYQSLC